MHEFKDTEARPWRIEITIGAIKAIRTDTEHDLLKLAETPEGGGQPPLVTLGTDVEAIVDIVWAAVQGQHEGVDAEAFGRSLGGQAFADMADAFWAELADFFHSLRRTDTAAAILKQAEAIGKVARAATMKIEAIDLDKTVAAAFGATSTSSPESPASAT